MKKKARKIVVCVMVVMSIFAVCSTAFAENKTTLNHRGTAKNSYVTTEYVNQMNDQYLVLNTHTITPKGALIDVCGGIKTSSGGFSRVTSIYNFSYPRTIVIPKSTSSRKIYLQLSNTGSYKGVSVTTSGNWTLKNKI